MAIEKMYWAMIEQDRLDRREAYLDEQAELAETRRNAFNKMGHPPGHVGMVFEALPDGQGFTNILASAADEGEV
jgi:hypothetical protein